MENKRKFKILDESESSERYPAGSLFKKHKASNEAKGQPTNSTTTNSATTYSATTYSTALAEAAPVSTSKTASATSTRRVATTATSSSTSVQQLKKEMKTGSNFVETFAFLKNSDMYELPPAPTVPEKVIPKNTNAIIVSPKQRGNPILKHIRNVPWEYGESLADYEMGKTTCALFLSLRYHNLNPDYIHERLKVLGKSYALRVLLVQVDVQKSKSSLKQLGKISILADCTLILAWSPEEAGRYLETYKQYENKPPDILQERVECEYLPKMQDVLTTIKSVNKTDVITLLSTFGSLKNLVEASVEEISLCPGFGPQKASRVYQAFFEPFKIDHTIRMAKLDELNKPSQLKKPQSRSPQKKQKTITDFASSSKTSDEQNIEKLLEEDFNVDLEVANEPSVENTSGDLFKNDTAIPSKLKSSDDKSYLSKSDAVMSSALSRHKNASPKKNILGKPTTSYASPKKSDPFSHSKITEKLTKKLSPSKRQTNVRNTTKAKGLTEHLGDKKLSPVKIFINTASHGSRETSANKISSAPQIRKSTRNSATTSNKKPTRASLESISQSTDQLVQQHTMISNEEYHDLLASSSGSDNDEE